MASVIRDDYGSGGAQMTPQGGAGEPPLVEVLRDGVDDMTELRTQFNALLAQLDTEGGLGGGYVAGFTPAAQKVTKG